MKWQRRRLAVIDFESTQLKGGVHIHTPEMAVEIGEHHVMLKQNGQAVIVPIAEFGMFVEEACKMLLHKPAEVIPFPKQGNPEP